MSLFIISGWARCSVFYRRWEHTDFSVSKTQTAFLHHIPNGLENLLIAIGNAGGLDQLSDLATECETILARKSY